MEADLDLAIMASNADADRRDYLIQTAQDAVWKILDELDNELAQVGAGFERCIAGWTRDGVLVTRITTEAEGDR